MICMVRDLNHTSARRESEDCRHSHVAKLPLRSLQRPLSYISIQETVDEGTKRGLGQTPAWVIEEQSRKRCRPFRQNALKLATPDRVVNPVDVVGIENPEALQGGFNDNVLMVRNERTVHTDLNLLASPFELPTMYRATSRKAPVNAGMAVQISRGLRFSVA